MPIRPENRRRYPKDWDAISRRIRFERADGRCECHGECGHDHTHAWDYLVDALQRCWAEHGQSHPVTGSIVVLTVAHLDHTPENCRDENLLAMCQRCHLAYDAEHHREQRYMNRRQGKAVADLFET